MFRHLFPFCTILALLVAVARSQENPDTTSTDPRVSPDILALSLEPLTEAELETKAGEWMAAVKDVATRIADAEIELIGRGSDPSEIGAELGALRETKADIISHTEIVLDAYELKGGDAGKHRKYLAAVAHTDDISTRIHKLESWLKSKDGGIWLFFNALKFTGIILLFWGIAVFASKLMNRAIERQKNLSALLKDFIRKMSRRIILVIGLIVALGTVGVNVGAALALIGGGAFILAFALQDTLSNFAAGMMLLIYRPFDVGSSVEIGGIKGKVDGVSMVSTTILTFDNQKVLVPNKKVWGETITNITGMTTRRVDMLFAIGYGDDIGKAEEIITRAVQSHPLILRDPAPNIGVHELADSSVNIRCWPWTTTGDYLAVRTDITRRIKEEFDAAGISIPFPQRDVYLHTVAPKG